MDDLISRRAAIDALKQLQKNISGDYTELDPMVMAGTAYIGDCIGELQDMPSAQPTLYGYDIEHLELIARVLQKEDLPPERVVEALTDIGRIVEIVNDEYEEALRKAVEQCTI